MGVLALACLIRLQAATITYTITTTATGTLGASSFTNASVTLALTGNTSAVTAGPGSLSAFLINPGTATLTIGGLGSATLTDSVEIVSSFNSTLGGLSAVVIVDTTNGGPADPTGILWTNSPAFLGYNLATALGPVSGTGSVANKGPADGFFSTTAGNLQFAAGQGGVVGAPTGTSAFTAVTTPEPGTLALAVVGVVAGWLRYRFSQQPVPLRLAQRTYPFQVKPFGGSINWNGISLLAQRTLSETVPLCCGARLYL